MNVSFMPRSAVLCARRLWEAGESAAGQPVVGVIGAGHIPGITKLWAEAGSAAVEERVKEYCSDPATAHAPDRMVNAIVGTAALGILGVIAYRRPRAVAYMAGATLALSAPAIIFSISSLNRFSRFATKLHNVAVDIDGQQDQFASDTVLDDGWK